MIIDGKKMAEEELAKVAVEVKKIKSPLKLVAVLIGDNTGSKKFLELKKRAAEKVGINFEIREFSEDLPEGVLASRLRALASLPENSGVLIELPLPRQYHKETLLNTVPVEKDVDVLSEAAQKKFFSGDFSILPPAVEAVKTILEKYQVVVKGKKAVVFGQGLLVGKPIAYWLYQQGVLVSVVDEFTKNPERCSQEADILIAGAGQPNLIKGAMVKEGAVVIDFGYNSLENKVVGDVNFAEVQEKCALITPVPGGVGPLVIAAVLKNLVILAKRKAHDLNHGLRF